MGLYIVDHCAERVVARHVIAEILVAYYDEHVSGTRKSDV